MITSRISFFYDHHIDSTEVQYQEPSSFDNTESPLCQMFSRKDHQESSNKNVSSGKRKGRELEVNGVVKPPGRTKNPGATPRKRTGNKDRHSKICTAQGVRDRRMRLSLPIAREFFDLQDMLGFDKASNTVEWLLSKSRNDIKKLLINHHLPPIKHSYLISSDDNDDDGGEEKITETLKQGDPNNEEARNEVITNEKKGGSKLGKVMKSYQNAKEAREKARARARERTREKMKAQTNKSWYDLNPTNNNLDQPFSAIEFYDLQKGAFLEDDAHPIDHIYENLGSFDQSISLIQMGSSHQMFNMMENNDEMIVPHMTDCSYTNNVFNWIMDDGNMGLF